jgi:23S rRNA pseudoU1915 N3-methylase RlmH
MKKVLIVLIAVIGISSSVFAQQKKQAKSSAQPQQPTVAVQQQAQEKDTVCIIQQPQQAQPKSYMYCELFGVTKSSFKLSKELQVMVNYGQKRKATIVIGGSGGVSGAFGDYITDENGKKIPFNSMIDALNYMGLQGWEFVQTYNTSVTGQKGLQLVFLLKKEIKPEERQQMEKDLQSEE